jgi:hydrogenase maturation protease
MVDVRDQESKIRLQQSTVVLGLGNPLMADEGIGVHLVERLLESADQYPAVDFIDAGTGGLSILYQIEDRRKAIDRLCLPGRAAGHDPTLHADQSAKRKVLAHQSLHEADLMHIIALRGNSARPRRSSSSGFSPAG